MPARTRRKAPTKGATANRDEMVGRLIEIEWPSDDTSTYYVALVLAYNPRRKQHKVVYLEDESIELMELGSGGQYRKWRPSELPSDELIGARLLLSDGQVGEGQETWFDFMRVNPDRRRADFEVYVYAHIEDPDPEEVTGPRKSGPECNYYRVIHSPNDYLTTVDLASVEYRIQESLKDVEQRDQEDGGDDASDAIDVDDPDDDTPLSRSVVNPARGTSKRIDVIPDDENPADDFNDDDDDRQPVATASSRGTGATTTTTKRADTGDAYDASSRGGADRDGGSVGLVDIDEDEPEEVDNDNDDALESKGGGASLKRIVRPRDTRVDADADYNDGTESDDDVDADPAVRRVRGARSGGASRDGRSGGSGSGGVARGQQEEEGEEDKMHDTASDEEMLGWAPRQSDRRGGDTSGSQVGDYISLDTGSGGPRRKAYVEAYLPATGTHFVAFCDTGGGNLQIKLTGDNHTVLGDKEAEILTRRQAGAKTVSVDVDDDMEVIDVEEEDVKPRGRGRLRRGASKMPVPLKIKKTEKKVSKSKAKASKRRYSMGKILGKSAGEEIVTRCITVVWPNTKPVYVALVMGYSYEARQHILLYMVDHCVETLDLRYREWNLLPRGKEPWNSSGMVGKRVFVWWPGEYEETETQELAERLFEPEETKVAYEAYVINFIGKGKYKIVYPSNEDCEDRELSAEKSEGSDPLRKEWDLLEQGVHEVMGLPVIGWEG